MLKQQTFFKKLLEKKINPYDYWILMKIHLEKIKPDANQAAWLNSRLSSEYVTKEGLPTDNAIKLMERMDEMFKPIKKLKSIDVLGPDGPEMVDEYISIFPEGMLPNGKYARGNKKGIQDKLIWFFQEYHYSWDIVLDAAEKYVSEFEKKNYEYMRTAEFFISKTMHGVVVSDLATYCEVIVNQEGQAKVNTFKTKVV